VAAGAPRLARRQGADGHRPVSILLAATPWLDAQQLALSVLGARGAELRAGVNHKPGRYVAV
jgi:hypothetical protein